MIENTTINECSMVSIIMPAYNAERYISECIQSIINQNIKGWELIVIDDGSTDTTLQLCKSYAKADARIKVFHQKNAGVSVARNRGLEKASGKYIVFVDADDILPKDSLKIRIQLMDNADMGIASYELIDSCGKRIETMLPCKQSFWNQRQAISNIVVCYGKIGYQGYLWNKIFLREIVVNNKLRFEPQIFYNEDRLFVVEYLLYSQKIRLCNDNVYKYRQNENGAMGCLLTMKDEDCDELLTEFISYKKMCDILKGFDKNLYHLCAADAQGRACWLRKEVRESEKKLKKNYRKCIRIFGIQAFYFGRGSLPLIKRIKIFAHVILGQ